MSLKRKLMIHKDKRGSLAELWKGEWGQVTFVTIAPGEVRGQHKHPNTNEEFVFLSGGGWLHLQIPCDGAIASLRVGGTLQAYNVPAGCGHSVEADAEGPLTMVYWSDRPYDPDSPDVEPWKWS